MVSNLNIHDYQHVQIKQAVKITTLNCYFTGAFISKNIAIFGPFGGHFEFFGGHPGFLMVRQVLTLQIGIPACSLHAKNRQSVRTTASNLSFRVCIGEFCQNLSSVAAILNFWWPFWIFIGSSCIKFSKLSTSFNTICKNHAINKNYSLKFEIRGALGQNSTI